MNWSRDIPWLMFDQYFGPSTNKTYEVVKKGKDECILYLSVPGYSRDDISVELHEGSLVIHGSLPEERTQTGLIAKTVDYVFDMTHGFKVEDASLESGILMVRVAREGRKSEPIKIPVLQRDK